MERMTTDSAARAIWNYMILGQPEGKNYLVLVLGSIDEHVASSVATVGT